MFKRDYINNNNLKIDGRNIPYTIFTAAGYLVYHDDLTEEEMYDFMEDKYEIYQRINQIIALKQSCYLLRRVGYSCESLGDDLYQLKLRLIHELRDTYHYEFDDDWMEDLVTEERK